MSARLSNVCVCVCACARARARISRCVCVRVFIPNLIRKHLVDIQIRKQITPQVLWRSCRSGSVVAFSVLGTPCSVQDGCTYARARVSVCACETRLPQKHGTARLICSPCEPRLSNECMAYRPAKSSSFSFVASLYSSFSRESDDDIDGMPAFIIIRSRSERGLRGSMSPSLKSAAACGFAQPAARALRTCARTCAYDPIVRNQPNDACTWMRTPRHARTPTPPARPGRSIVRGARRGRTPASRGAPTNSPPHASLAPLLIIRDAPRLLPDPSALWLLWPVPCAPHRSVAGLSPSNTPAKAEGAAVCTSGRTRRDPLGLSACSQQQQQQCRRYRTTQGAATADARHAEQTCRSKERVLFVGFHG